MIATLPSSRIFPPPSVPAVTVALGRETAMRRPGLAIRRQRGSDGPMSHTDAVPGIPENTRMAHRGMKFGIFLAPFHRVGDNPTLAIAATSN